MLVGCSARLADSALQSWELGTCSQATLELNTTGDRLFCLFFKHITLLFYHTLRPHHTLVVANRTVANNHTVSPQPFLPDGMLEIRYP